ncbi:MAG: cytochrome-c peroxidase [Deltaproteobacteria bacterium]|nr:cytochrome-c peroxidase [Deltaproteobacteria bacterium]
MQKTLPWLTLALPALLTGCPDPDEPPEFQFPPNRPVFGDVTEAAVPPPPISGGTLLVTRTGYAVASDPDRDTIHLVNTRPSQPAETATITLEPRDEPGRGVEDSDGRVHVVLRRGGAVLTLDPIRGEVLRRRAVCAAPRGIALDGTDLLVVCAGGEFVRLPTAEGAATRVARLEPDLRDVVVSGGQVYVSAFRSARVLQVSRRGEVSVAFRPRSFREEGEDAREFAPAVAWRMVPTRAGVAVLHQRATTSVVDVAQTDVHSAERRPTARRSGGYGPPPAGEGPDTPGCRTGIVQSTVSMLPAAGGTPPVPFPGTFLVDLAQQDGVTAVVGPGNAHLQSPDFRLGPGGPTTFGAPPSISGGSQLLVVRDQDLEEGGATRGCSLPTVSAPENFNAELTAVAFDPTGGDLWVQSREPARLFRVRVFGARAQTLVDLRGPSRRDSGHEVFHANAGGDIACASCHPEGGDDGRTWRFSFGARRTQNLRGGITGTEPLHWDGDMRDMNAISSEVFTRRMNGDPLRPEQVGALRRWIDAIPTVPHGVAEDPEAVLRGRAVFERADTACAGCHAGARGTNNQSVDVGTGGRMQVPALTGVLFRGPFMHTGCAGTLADRFDPRCGGGDAHGRTSQLSRGELTDLVSYLETL